LKSQSLIYYSFFIYGSICVIAIIFTFLLDTCNKIDETFKMDILSTRILTPLGIIVDWFDNWVKSYNKIFGPILILLSLVDLKLFFDIINTL
jgi:hypothetical protein